MWSITQPLFGRLQQRVVEQEHEPAARREHARDLRDRRPVIGQVLEHEARDRGVERRVGERQLLGGRRAGSADRRARSARDRELRARSGRRRRRARRRASSRAARPALRRCRRRRRACAPARHSAASGRICSSYSGSAPSVKPSCHQRAFRSHASRSLPWEDQWDVRTRRRVTNGGVATRRCRRPRDRDRQATANIWAGASRRPISNEKRSAFGPKHKVRNRRRPRARRSANRRAAHAAPRGQGDRRDRQHENPCVSGRPRGPTSPAGRRRAGRPLRCAGSCARRTGTCRAATEPRRTKPCRERAPDAQRADDRQSLRRTACHAQERGGARDLLHQHGVTRARRARAPASARVEHEREQNERDHQRLGDGARGYSK